MRTRYILIGVVLGVLLSTVVVVLAGDPATPPGPPDSTYSYSLEDLYDRLSTGAIVISDTFKEPVDGPGTGSMYTLNEIMEVAPAVTTTAAISTEVRAGKAYWSLNAGEWGEGTGALHGGCHCECDSCSIYNKAGGGTRWCDSGHGTVIDLLGHNGVGQCLVWLQNAGWGLLWPWVDNVNFADDAHARASSVTDYNDPWRLPTYAELYALTNGVEAVSSADPHAFINIESAYYWSSTSAESDPQYAFYVHLGGSGTYVGDQKTNSHWVWPVRSGD